MENIILATDSYKLGHWRQYPEGTDGVYSYFESRKGATYPYTVFFGLQYILRRYLEGLEGDVVSPSDVMQARDLARDHFGRDDLFNYDGWMYVARDLGGKLPIKIKAVPEGTPVPTGNVLMTVENTDPKCYWLTNALESLLTHVWYPSTVATVSRCTLELIRNYLDTTGTRDALPFMLHDFGYRGATSDESAAIGGCAHLVNSMGTDTVPALVLAGEYYHAPAAGFSVPATEHSVMTSLGKDGERDLVDSLLDNYPSGILSVVADSYNVYEFVKDVSTRLRDRILERDGVFVVRPDSVTPRHTSPAALTAWIVGELYTNFGGHVNSKGYRVLDQHVRVLWGDGIDPAGINHILQRLQNLNYSAENMVFGMGGGLLQKMNRDTQRFAFKASAIKRDGVWHDVYKQPLDESKTSKRGRLQLSLFVDQHGVSSYETLAEGTRVDQRSLRFQRPRDVLEIVFENGQVTRDQTLQEIRENSGIL